MRTESLFTEIEDERRREVAPLAVRMRPRTLDDIVGQEDAVGEGSWLRAAIEADTLSSVILFGPAGTGKTSIAHVIAETTKATFVEVSAIGGTVSDLRREISEASRRLETGGIRTILFVDEIHRFNRSQQDALLHAVEDRVVVLIGATTENPFFEVNSALISRSRVVELHSLSDEAIALLIERALDDPSGLNGAYALTPEARDAIVLLSGGDGRGALTTLELAASLAVGAQSGTKDGSPGSAQGDTQGTVKGDAQGSVKDGASDSTRDSVKDDAKGGAKSTSQDSQLPQDPQLSQGPQLPQDSRPSQPLEIDESMVRIATPHRTLPYDKNKDMHYDVISAFIKSMRGSDPDAALYWLARMIDGGEDPKFIARRIFILAAEDIGNADPQALLIAEAAFRSAEVIGYPECQLILAQAATYMALAPKSNAACGIFTALDAVRQGHAAKVPDHLRDRHRPGSEDYGRYLYPHNYPDAWVDQQYLPDGVERGAFYQPSERGWEAYRGEILENRYHEMRAKHDAKTAKAALAATMEEHLNGTTAKPAKTTKAAKATKATKATKTTKSSNKT